jgi:hypothetical protein
MLLELPKYVTTNDLHLGKYVTTGVTIATNKVLPAHVVTRNVHVTTL